MWMMIPIHVPSCCSLPLPRNVASMLTQKQAACRIASPGMQTWWQSKTVNIQSVNARIRGRCPELRVVTAIRDKTFIACRALQGIEVTNIGLAPGSPYPAMKQGTPIARTTPESQQTHLHDACSVQPKTSRARPRFKQHIWSDPYRDIPSNFTLSIDLPSRTKPKFSSAGAE